MADATTRLDELRKQKAAAEARIQTFRHLVAKLRSMIDSGQLKVAIRGGRMLIALPNDQGGSDPEQDAGWACEVTSGGSGSWSCRSVRPSG
jgi:hypothetical protein